MYLMYTNSKISSKPETIAQQGKELLVGSRQPLDLRIETPEKACDFGNFEVVFFEFGTIFVKKTQDRETQNFEPNKTLVERERE